MGVHVQDRKGPHRLGYWARSKHEHPLIGTRGNVPAPAPGTQWASVIKAPVGGHSVKPEAALEMIESYFPNLPKIELHRRGAARPGWNAWGDEVTPQDLVEEANGLLDREAARGGAEAIAGPATDVLDASVVGRSRQGDEVTPQDPVEEANELLDREAARGGAEAE